jgi:hypothetical protein
MTSDRPALQWPLVERREQERRLAEQQLACSAYVDLEDRRLGLGRRLDDWRRRQDAA